jgi:hypothetical protein
MPNVRQLPVQESRVESGAIRFGADWPGLFLRGDQAMWLAHCLKHTIARLEGTTLLPSERVMMAPLKALINHIEKDVDANA